MRTIKVYDERFGGIVFVGEHKNVPEEWTVDNILKRFGIDRHLRVYQISDDGKTRVIQPGDQP
jgi:hypothetical protein